MNKEREEVLNRILHLENVGVGCGPECLCRAYSAALLTDEQAASLEVEAKAAVFDHKEPIGEKSPEQVNTLERIAHDKLLPDRKPDEKGGRQGAENALDELVDIYNNSSFEVMLVRVMGGDLDMANMSDDDIRRAAYSR
jgi:hypothetical protein